ncbi:MAG TPA: TonB-dependent receptor [Devosiaceae bacterium]|jgi:hypothetical protein|nr:TonB-dependent receptor [Devosiaceae bacterium]
MRKLLHDRIENGIGGDTGRCVNLRYRRWLPVAAALAALLSTPAAAQDAGFSITVDGEHVAGDPVVATPATKLQPEDLDIQVKFDGLGIEPILNVSTEGLRVGYRAGETVVFQAATNYPDWISSGEVAIFDVERVLGRPYAVVPLDGAGRATWVMPGDGAGRFTYVLRVYDQARRLDETRPLPLVRTALTDGPGDLPKVADWHEDRTATRSIPVYGGSVTVIGRNVPATAEVVALGGAVQVDGDGSFVAQRVLPPGEHRVDVTVGGEEGVAFSRTVNIPWSEWFYVGMADLTVGKMFGSGKVVAADPSEFDDVYAKGRVAFYLKGKIKGEYLLTAAADTGEDKLDQLFTGLDSKDPRALLKRIDPDQFYPVYGDGSTLVEDAPTSGKFYVRLERGESHVMWGDFKTHIGGTEFLGVERSLYGASALYKSEHVNSRGESRAGVVVYAATPGTLSQRDVLRGTGGSAYFLKRQDISIGSEVVSIEVRDGTTGMVLSRRTLVNGRDYEIDYFQGIIVLKAPLHSGAAAAGAIREQAHGQGVANLVVQYEYTPANGMTDGMSFGGRAESWLTDHVSVGVTGLSETGDLEAHQMLGADVRLQLTDTTFIEAEIAHSEGTSVGQWVSTDGGLTYTHEVASPGAGPAMAYRVAGQLDLADLTAGEVEGLIGAYVEKVEEGFSSIGRQAVEDELTWSTFARLELGAQAGLGLSFESRETGDGRLRRNGDLEVGYDIDERWSADLGVRVLEAATPAGDASDNGVRVDAGVQLTYRHSDDTKFYTFGQATLWKTPGFLRNDRAGVGAELRVSEQVGVNGEVSYGTTGLGGLAAITFDPNADEHNYIGYRLNSDEEASPFYSVASTERSGLVVGTRRRYDDLMTAHAENNLGLFGDEQALTSTYGLTLTPDTLWTISGGLESGRIVDPHASDFDRNALSLGVAYTDDEAISGHVRGETRLEDSSDDTRDRQTYLFDAGLEMQTSDDWRLLADIDAVVSNSDQSAVLDGDFVEVRLGYAFRPVAHDRLNALLRYTYLYDLPGPDQVNGDGNLLGPKQRSHVLSGDFSYDLNDYLTVGAKYGFRIGEVSVNRASDEFVSNSAHLGIVRADIEVLENWGMLLEGRALYAPETTTVDLGALAVISYDFGNNLRLGAGYNFGSFSDDLTDLTHDDHGVFLNVLSKF